MKRYLACVLTRSTKQVYHHKLTLISMTFYKRKVWERINLKMPSEMRDMAHLLELCGSFWLTWTCCRLCLPRNDRWSATTKRWRKNQQWKWLGKIKYCLIMVGWRLVFDSQLNNNSMHWPEKRMFDHMEMFAVNSSDRLLCAWQAPHTS